MQIHHLRNATFVIEVNDKFILVDPMLGKKASMQAFTAVRFKPIKNPLVELPSNSAGILEKVTHCLITHLHPDHLDEEGIRFLKDKNIPVFCSINDVKALQKNELNIEKALDYWKKETFFDGIIIGIPAVHGYGPIAEQMGNVMGFYMEFLNEKSIYISSDTVYTDDVHKVLKELQPDISVLAGGSAQLDEGEPILMTMKDLIQFIQDSPHKIYANHLEALNHCPTTRIELKEAAKKHSLQHKVFIPDDGESILF